MSMHFQATAKHRKGGVMLGLSVPALLILAVIAFFLYKRYAH